MARGYGKKKTLKEKANAVFKKLIVATALIGTIGGAGYYEYGTIQEQDVTIKHLQSVGEDSNGDNAEWKGRFVFNTDKGDFIAEPSLPHLHSQKRTNELWDLINEGKTYHIKTYGIHIFGNLQPNIIDAYEVSAEELQAREEKRAKDAEQAAAALLEKKMTKPAAAQPTVVYSEAGLSGDMVMLNVTASGYNVQVTIPVEAAGKLTVNSVRPLAPPAPRTPRS